MSKPLHEVVRTVLDRHNIERVLSPVAEILIRDIEANAPEGRDVSGFREPILMYLRMAGEQEPRAVRSARIVRETRHRIQLLEELLETGPAYYAQYEDLLRKEREILEDAHVLGMKDRLPRGRPQSAKYTAALEIYREIAGAASLWQACTIIAEMYVEAGIDARPVEDIHNELYGELDRKVRKIPPKPGYS